MNFVETKYALYVDAMKRTRWMLLLTVILSCLILMHIYLEQFSLEKAQIVEALKDRKKKNLEALLKEQEDKIAALHKAAPPNEKELDERAYEYARLKYRMTLSDNILKGIQIPERAVPLLSFTVPGNDFLPIVGTMLLVFAIAVWLSLRSVVATLQSLQREIDEPLREVMRLQFTFTGLHDNPGTERTLARSVQLLAFVLPAGSFLVAVSIDAWSAFAAILDPAIGTPGPAGLLWFRFACMLSELLLLIVVTVVSVLKIQEVGRLAGN